MLRRAHSRWFAIPIALVISTLSIGEAGAATALTGVKILDEQHATAVKLTLDGPTPEVRSFVDGDRLIVELPFVEDRSGTGTINVDSGRASLIEVVALKNKLQIVIVAGTATDPFYGRGVAPTDDGLLITVGTDEGSSGAAAPLARVAASGAVTAVAASAAAKEGARTAAPPEDDAPTTLTRVDVLDAHHATALQLHLEGAPPKVTVKEEQAPHRLEVILPGVTDESGTAKIVIGGLRATQVDIVPTVEGVKLVIFAGDAEDPFEGFRVSNTDVGMLVTVGTGKAVAKGGAATAAAAAAGAGAAGGSSAGEAGAGAAAAATAAAAAPDEMEDDGSGPQPVRADGDRFRVSAFQVVYGMEHPDLPPAGDILKLDVPLGVTAKGYVAPRDDVPVEVVRLIDTRNAPQQYYYGSAIRSIDEAIVADFNRRGQAGVLVIPHEEDIDPQAGRDLRTPDRSAMRLVVWVGRLLEFRTFASGDRVPDDARIDNPVHQRIKDQSPVRPGGLLDKDELDDYTAFLSRHPGRNVDLALSAAREPGGVYLDFLVAENKPITAYVQGSNTGTSETTDWRQRFGFAHTQLTGHDDILRLDYITGDFSEVQAVFGSYSGPVYDIGRYLRWSVGASYSEYDASQFGFVNSKFHGEQWEVNGELVASVFQWQEIFVDLVAGARFQQVKTINKPDPAFKTTGETNFFLPAVGMRFERLTDTSSVRGFAGAEFNVPSIAGTQHKELIKMGRTQVNDRQFQIFRWDLLVSFYLEPLFDPSGYDDPSTPSSSTLAHEMVFSTRGQNTFNTRVIPQMESVLGGLYSVRGYSQSLVAGDTVILGRSEYRLHIPRLLPIQPIPWRIPWIGDFRASPQQVYSRPDWDLVFKVFLDAGKTIPARSVPGEQNETLVGAGFGFELNIMDHLVLTLDYGTALKKVRKNQPDTQRAGHDEIYFTGTLIY